MRDDDAEERLTAFDTRSLLRAVDDVDLMRGHLDGDGNKPPEIRDDVMRLHQLAMRVVNHGSTDKEVRREMFDLAGDLETRIDELADAIDRLRETIGTLAALEPDDLED